MLVAWSARRLAPRPGRSHHGCCQALCERDGRRLWGVPLYAPMVIGDMRTQTFITS